MWAVWQARQYLTGKWYHLRLYRSRVRNAKRTSCRYTRIQGQRSRFVHCRVVSHTKMWHVQMKVETALQERALAHKRPHLSTQYVTHKMRKLQVAQSLISNSRRRWDKLSEATVGSIYREVGHSCTQKMQLTVALLQQCRYSKWHRAFLALTLDWRHLAVTWKTCDIKGYKSLQITSSVITSGPAKPSSGSRAALWHLWEIPSKIWRVSPIALVTLMRL